MSSPTAVESLRTLKAILIVQLKNIDPNSLEGIEGSNELKALDGMISRLAQANLSTSKYSQRFMLLVNYIIDNFEKGFANNSSDPGGPTMWGLSSRYNPEVPGIVNGTLKKSAAIDVYYKKYYKPLYKIELIDPGLAAIIFDAVIHGSRETIKDIQTYLKQFNKSIDVDGSYGKQTGDTLLLLNSVDLNLLISHLIKNARKSADKAGDRVDASQRKLGLTKNNYDDSFESRLLNRYSLGASLVNKEI